MKKIIASFFIFLFPLLSASALKPGSAAPLFSLKDHEGQDFNLADRKSKGWTVLFFYPKADTPGCTTQACAFRDATTLISDQGASVFGISVNSVEDQKKFHEKHKLNFPLLADTNAQVTKLYQAKMPILKMAKRTTFVIDDKLTIQWIFENVDPAIDAKQVAEKIRELKK